MLGVTAAYNCVINMPAQHKIKDVNMEFINEETVEEIVQAPYVLGKTLPYLPLKRPRKTSHRTISTESTKEQNKTSNTTMQEDLPGQILLPSGDCAEATVASQTPGSASLKTAKKRKEDRVARKSTEQQQTSVEVYVAKFTSAETRLVSNEADGVVSDGTLSVLSSNSGKEEEDTENTDAAIITNVLESEFFKVKCAEMHVDQGQEKDQHDRQTSEDYFSFTEQTQESSERQDQVHEGDDDQICAVSDHSNKNPGEPLLMSCETATCYYDGLEFREVATKEVTLSSSIEQSEGQVKDVDCSERASATANEELPGGSSDMELTDSEEVQEKLRTPHSPTSSLVYALPDKSLDQSPNEVSHTGPEQMNSEFKPVAEACIVDTVFPLDSLGNLDVTFECEVQTGDVEQSSSLFSSPASPEFKQSRVRHVKWKRNSRGRRIKTFIGLERISNETVESESIEPRHHIVRSKRHSEFRNDESKVCSQNQASVITRTATRTPRTVVTKFPRTVDRKTPRTSETKTPRTVDTKTPRTATKRKAVAELTPNIRFALREELSATAKSRLKDERADRSLQRKSFSAETDAMSELKSMSLPMKTGQPVVRRGSKSRQTMTLEPVSAKNAPFENISPKKSVTKPRKYNLLGKSHSLDQLKCRSSVAKNSASFSVDESSSVNRCLDTVDEEPLCADQTLPEKLVPPLKIKSIISSMTHSTAHQVNSTTVDGLDEIIQEPCDSAYHSTDTASSTQDPVRASRNVVPTSKPKSNVAYVLPPPEYISFNRAGDVEISDIIMNALPQLAENGFSQIYLLTNTPPIPLSSRQERLVFTADLNSTPFKFIPTTSFPSTKSDQRMRADKVPESQTQKELPGSQKLLGKQHLSKRGRPRKATTLCSSTFSDGLVAEDESPSMNVDTPSSTQQIVSPTGDNVNDWTSVDTSAWLAEHGLNRLIPSIDGPSLKELAIYVNQDEESATGYLLDMEFSIGDLMQLFDALKTIPTQIFRQTCSSSVEGSHAGAADLSSKVMSTPKRRRWKIKFGRRRPLKVTGGTNSPEIRASKPTIPLSQWTHEDVSAWLTAHGLSRCLPEFADFNGQKMSTLVQLFNRKVGPVYKMLSHFDFTLTECLKFCASLRDLSQSSPEDVSLNSTKS